MAIKMDGKALAEKMRGQIRDEVAALRRKVEWKPIEHHAASGARGGRAAVMLDRIA